MQTNDNNIGVSIIMQDLEKAQELRKAVVSTPGFQLLEDPGEKRDSVVLVEVNGRAEHMLKEAFELKRRGLVGGVIMTARNYQQDLLLRCIQMGVDEFLPSPLSPDDFLAALRRYRIKHLTEQGGDSNGKSIAVLGARSGVGTTTIAVGLAYWFLEQKKKVAIIDLARPHGDLSLFMDVEHEYSWKDAFVNLRRMDGTFLKSLMFEHKKDLFVLPAPTSLQERSTINADGVQELIFGTLEQFDIVIIDAGSMLDNTTLMTLERVDLPIVVSLMSLPILASTKYTLDLCRQISPPLGERMKLVINRFSSKSVLEKEEVTSITGKEIFAEIQEDPDKVLAAINRGIPLFEAYPGSIATKGIRTLGGKLIQGPRTSLFGGL
ncbi:AAA family ATPase [Desulfovibrio mangrovi]|uniref:nucleotide-binding protein n=1 Tax=Desulfovibrio mangrovi TaxID=2976983 RepID=UPI002246CA2E|nr:AAA family ATPase [Desulfovibrio mangrovi]UZP68796.1 AAA family ATPase [Desulfovibrio mangrovi]